MVCGGGKRYITNVCMYAALFRLYSGIITQTARCRRRTESVPHAFFEKSAKANGRNCSHGMQWHLPKGM